MPSSIVNQKLLCMVTEVDKEDRNLVVSRRALLEKEREEQREKLWDELAEGQVRHGIIGNVRDFGAFVDLGGVDGLLHVSEISWKRIPDATAGPAGRPDDQGGRPEDRPRRNARSASASSSSKPTRGTISTTELPRARLVKGKVTRTMDFGAFVELEPGVEGLIHISELARNKVWRVTDIVKPGQDVEVKVLSVDPEAAPHLAVVAGSALPEEVVKTEEEEEEAIAGRAGEASACAITCSREASAAGCGFRSRRENRIEVQRLGGKPDVLDPLFQGASASGLWRELAAYHLPAGCAPMLDLRPHPLADQLGASPFFTSMIHSSVRTSFIAERFVTGYVVRVPFRDAISPCRSTSGPCTRRLRWRLPGRFSISGPTPA